MSDAADIAAENQAIYDRELSERLVREQEWRAARPGTPHCEECGFDIPAARREALPWATRCVECQEYVDRLTARHR